MCGPPSLLPPPRSRGCTPSAAKKSTGSAKAPSSNCNQTQKAAGKFPPGPCGHGHGTERQRETKLQPATSVHPPHHCGCGAHWSCAGYVAPCRGWSRRNRYVRASYVPPSVQPPQNGPTRRVHGCSACCSLPRRLKTWRVWELRLGLGWTGRLRVQEPQRRSLLYHLRPGFQAQTERYAFADRPSSWGSPG